MWKSAKTRRTPLLLLAGKFQHKFVPTSFSNNYTISPKYLRRSINAVRNYALGSNLGDVIANFDPPTGIENCDITYEVRETETECYTKEVNVAAYNERIYSEWVFGVVEIEVSAVETLQAIIADASIEVNWREPNSAAACAVTYQIDVNDLTFVNSGSSATIPVSNLPACVATNVTVTPISSSGKVGVPAYIGVTPGSSATIPVSNLPACVATNVTVTPISSSGKVGVPAYIGVTPELDVVQDLALTSGNNCVRIMVSSGKFGRLRAKLPLRIHERKRYVSLVVVAYGADGSESGRASASLVASC
ncbi:hypothetical protein QE152_g25198 [Popillia japonica]|uniref:Uncharacterized protein n=1 Tax=Popillia japonica TaxID=7064 RepID=A0AAW1K2A2_POPJA